MRSVRGYLTVGLSQHSRVTQKNIHQLVATCFIPNIENKPQVNHLDGNKTNPQVENLEWATNSENCQHAYDTRLRPHGELHGTSKLTQKQVIGIRQRLKAGELQYKLAEEFGVTKSNIGKIHREETWKLQP
jgi:hypothetical protein